MTKLGTMRRARNPTKIDTMTALVVPRLADVFGIILLRQALPGVNVFAGRTAKESLDHIYKGPKIPLLKEDPEVPFAVDADKEATEIEEQIQIFNDKLTTLRQEDT